ncbi:MAG: hypothetical protein KAI55_03505, partial [Candidatus Aenigmarchaeota archaeon]|nr:hypothetical protein [Candidatus Aenigmarchaeota archaeon]
ITGSIKDASVNKYEYNYTGFESGSTMMYFKEEGTMGLIALEFTAYKFDSKENAKIYYSNKINKVKEEGGYTELKNKLNSECFTYKIDRGMEASFGKNICIKENIVFQTDITTSYTFRRAETYLKYADFFESKIN